VSSAFPPALASALSALGGSHEVSGGSPISALGGATGGLSVPWRAPPGKRVEVDGGVGGGGAGGCYWRPGSAAPGLARGARRPEEWHGTSTEGADEAGAIGLDWEADA